MTRRRLQWLELTPGYQCNNRCLGCFSASDEGPSMDAKEVRSHLAEGLRQGATSLWLGGGEPTIRRELLGVVREARRLGYVRVKVQTNGMMLGYGDFAQRCIEAGVTEVNLSIKGATAETHDAIAQTPGCHALMVQAVEKLRALGVPVEGDVLVYQRNVAELPDIVRAYTPLGVSRYHLWMFSTTDAGRGLDGEIPRATDVLRYAAEAKALGLSDREDFIVSLHTPPCVVPASMRGSLFFARDLDLLVTNPGGQRFRLETSPMEGGVYLDRCAACSERSRCGGLRADYLRVHGDAEFQALP